MVLGVVEITALLQANNNTQMWCSCLWTVEKEDKVGCPVYGLFLLNSEFSFSFIFDSGLSERIRVIINRGNTWLTTGNVGG